MRNKRRGGWLMLFLICTAAVPTTAMLVYGAAFPDFAAAAPYLATGAALGALHVLARPILRVLFAPLGCLTFGLAGTGIDIALIYLAGYLVDGFYAPSIWYALITALLINAASGILGVKKH